MKQITGRKLLITLITLLNPLALSCLISIIPKFVLVGMITIFCSASAYLAYITDSKPKQD